jgi:hypothetical protein
MTAKKAMASKAARRGMHRLAKAQPSNTRATYQSKDDAWKAAADCPNSRWSSANDKVVKGRNDGGLAPNGSSQKVRLNASVRGAVP